jgi:hypothetical protein
VMPPHGWRQIAAKRSGISGSVIRTM